MELRRAHKNFILSSWKNRVATKQDMEGSKRDRLGGKEKEFGFRLVKLRCISDVHGEILSGYLCL